LTKSGFISLKFALTQNHFSMKIALLSDTHGFFCKRTLELLEGVDEIWHAGDIGDIKITDKLSKVAHVRAVYGNIDNHVIRATFKRDEFFEINGLKILMTHIGGYPPKYNRLSLPLLDSLKPDVFICGHSHILKIIYDQQRSCLHLNPGALGNHGFHKKRTFLRFEINEKVENMEIVELGGKNFKLPNAID